MKKAVRPRVVRALLVAAVLLAYPAAGLFPYQWDLPFVAVNTAYPLPGGGLRLAPPGPGIARSNEPPPWVGTAMEEHRFSVRLRVRPFSVDQNGPARILTLSYNPSLRNFTLAQEGEDLIVRIRTPKHTFNGVPDYVVPDVFRTGQWVDIRVQVEPNALTAQVDGKLKLHDKLPDAPLRDWDRSYLLALGNELTGDRSWLGEIHRAAVRMGETSVDYAAPDVLQRPSRLWYFHRAPALVPLQDIRPGDAVLNLLGFIPLGLVLGAWASRRGRRAVWLVLTFVFVVSLALEFLQVGLPRRYPSINDVIFNTLGGFAGIILAGRFRGLRFAADERDSSAH